MSTVSTIRSQSELFLFAIKKGFRNKNKFDDFLVLFQTEPSPSPYFSEMTMTLLSVVQGIAIAILVSNLVNSDFTHWTNGRVAEIIVGILFLMGLWHRYVQHHQFVGWQLTIWDSFILLAVGVVEGFVVATLSNSNALGQVHVWIACGFGAGCVAYWYSAHQMQLNYVKKIYEHKYKDRGTEVYFGMLGYEKHLQFVTIIFTILFVLVVALGLSQPLSLLPSIVSILLFITYLGIWDQNNWISDEARWDRLRRFGGFIPPDK